MIHIINIYRIYLKSNSQITLKDLFSKTVSTINVCCVPLVYTFWMCNEAKISADFNSIETKWNIYLNDIFLIHNDIRTWWIELWIVTIIMNCHHKPCGQQKIIPLFQIKCKFGAWRERQKTILFLSNSSLCKELWIKSPWWKNNWRHASELEKILILRLVLQLCNNISC